MTLNADLAGLHRGKAERDGERRSRRREADTGESREARETERGDRGARGAGRSFRNFGSEERSEEGGLAEEVIHRGLFGVSFPRRSCRGGLAGASFPRRSRPEEFSLELRLRVSAATSPPPWAALPVSRVCSRAPRFQTRRCQTLHRLCAWARTHPCGACFPVGSCSGVDVHAPSWAARGGWRGLLLVWGGGWARRRARAWPGEVRSCRANRWMLNVEFWRLLLMLLLLCYVPCTRSLRLGIGARLHATAMRYAYVHDIDR